MIFTKEDAIGFVRDLGAVMREVGIAHARLDAPGIEVWLAPDPPDYSTLFQDAPAEADMGPKPAIDGKREPYLGEEYKRYYADRVCKRPER